MSTTEQFTPRATTGAGLDTNSRQDTTTGSMGHGNTSHLGETRSNERTSGLASNLGEHASNHGEHTSGLGETRYPEQQNGYNGAGAIGKPSDITPGHDQRSATGQYDHSNRGLESDATSRTNTNTNLGERTSHHDTNLGERTSHTGLDSSARPETTSNVGGDRTSSIGDRSSHTNTTSSSAQRDAGPGDNPEYPEQRHAGAIGYGPNFHSGPSMADKASGMKEVLKGKITKNPELVSHGKEKQTGALAQKERESDMQDSPFANPEEEGETKHNMKDRAAGVAPEGTEQREAQRETRETQRV